MNRPSRSFLRLAATAAALLFCTTTIQAQKRGEIILATTTSTQDTGLLDSLLPMFQLQTGIEVKPIAVGTGAALEMARRGDADAVLVHAPEAEKAYVESGDLIGGRRIMHNDFLIIGPTGDPAKVRGQKDAALAMKAIAEAGSFVSRGADRERRRRSWSFGRPQVCHRGRSASARRPAREWVRRSSSPTPGRPTHSPTGGPTWRSRTS